MSRWADWFAISPGQVDLFGDNAADNPVIEELLLPLFEPAPGDPPQPPHVGIDKIWEPIHRSLAGDRAWRTDVMDREHPLDMCVLGGMPLLRVLGRNNRTAHLVDDTTVPEVAAAMQAVTRDWLREGFFRIAPGQFHAIDEDTFREVWRFFREVLVPFYQQAADTERGVLVVISH